MSRGMRYLWQNFQKDFGNCEKQREMAEICGLKLRGYQQYEYNESYPEVPGLVALADFFGVSLDYLMGRSDKREISR